MQVNLLLVHVYWKPSNICSFSHFHQYQTILMEIQHRLRFCFKTVFDWDCVSNMLAGTDRLVSLLSLWL